MSICCAISISHVFGLAIATGNVVKLLVHTHDGHSSYASAVIADGEVLALAISPADNSNFSITFGTHTGIYNCCTVKGQVEENLIRRLGASTIRWTTASVVSSTSSSRFICSNDEGIYLTGNISNAEEVSLLKIKLTINSEIGPQNRLLLFKDKLTIVRIHVVAKTGPYVVIMSKSK